MYGNGPYVFIDNNTIFPNQFAYSKKTNLLFVDNPAGVGYSWAKRSLDKTTNDYQFSLDAISFITQFFGEWPELTKNPLFVAGHSYGGIYAPYLTWQLHQHNEFVKAQDPLTKNVFNLQGWIVANGIVDFNYDGFVRQAPELYSAFNIIPRYALDDARKNKCEYWFIGAFPERQ